MNPVIILILIFVFGNLPGRKGPILPPIRKFPPPMRPSYIDTFRIELLLDRLHSMTNALEKVNHLNQMQKVPSGKGPAPSMDRIQESLEAVKGFLADGKSSQQVDSLSNTLSGVKNFSNMEQLMTTMGPILSMLKNSGEK